eukprot:3341582-Amphidinium_carterae.1
MSVSTDSRQKGASWKARLPSTSDRLPITSRPISQGRNHLPFTCVSAKNHSEGKWSLKVHACQCVETMRVAPPYSPRNKFRIRANSKRWLSFTAQK